MSSLRYTQETLIVQSIIEAARRDGFNDLPAGINSEVTYFRRLDEASAASRLSSNGAAVMRLINQEGLNVIVARQIVARWALYCEFKDQDQPDQP